MSVSSTSNNATDKASIEETLSPTSVVVSAALNNANSSMSAVHQSDSNHTDTYCADSDNMGSPTSVTMVCSSSSATLLPTAAAAVVTTKPSPAAPMIPKPFFVMDWLEEINPRDLEVARQMLNTPTKKKGRQTQHERSQSTPSFRKSPPPTSTPASNQKPQKPPQTRSSINLPTLNHKEDDSVCRQLYPAAEPSNESALPNEDDSQSAVDMTISRTTSATSVSTVVSAAEVTTPKQSNMPSTKMSPFKKRSIAIGNGWNAKGLHKAKKGSWESALACWENALEIRSQVLGETHPDVANTCNNIGIALGKLGRFDEAIEVLERALKLRAKHYGTREHVEVAATLHNIGNVLHAAQDCAGAIQCFWDAKLLQEQLLGPNHVQVARACVAIANVYYEAQQYEDAREAYLDALQVFTNAGLSDVHPEILAIQQDLRDIEAICQARLQHHHHQQQQYPSHLMSMADYPHPQVYWQHPEHTPGYHTYQHPMM